MSGQAARRRRSRSAPCCAASRLLAVANSASALVLQVLPLTFEPVGADLVQIKSPFFLPLTTISPVFEDSPVSGGEADGVAAAAGLPGSGAVAACATIAVKMSIHIVSPDLYDNFDEPQYALANQRADDAAHGLHFAR